MKQRQASLILDLPVPLQLAMMMMMVCIQVPFAKMWIQVPLAKKRYENLLESLGVIATPYLSPYVHKSGVLDAEYGLRKVGDKFFIGNSDVKVNTNSDFYIRNKHFKDTRGLWELLVKR